MAKRTGRIRAKAIKKSLEKWIGKNFPFIRYSYRFAKWRLFLKFHRFVTRLRNKNHGLNVDPYKIISIDPKRLKYSVWTTLKWDALLDTGARARGNWDKLAFPTENLDIVQAAKHRFNEGGDWEDTEYYKKHLKIISSGEEWRGCRTREDLDKYFKRFDVLCEKIKKEGYRNQDEIQQPEFAGKGMPENEIAVHIDRNGRVLFGDGAHRLSIALALGIESIPVIIRVRHTQWYDFISDIVSCAAKKRGKVYQPVTHPDLSDIPSAHGEKRYEMIKSHLQNKNSTLLDIGAHWGYFCHRFEELGFDCYAVENDPESFYFLKKLKNAEERRFKIIEKSILEYREKQHFDIVLALNIFHHFLKNKSDYEALIAFLNYMDIDTMFFEPHNPEEPQMENAYRNYRPDDFVEFIKEHSILNHSEFIGQAEDSRSLYKLEK